MARIPESVINEILDKADIESVVSRYVSLTKRSGTNRWGLCPFHADTKPSFCVSITKNIYSCFVCQKTGNAVSFIMEMEHLNYPEAIRFLGKAYGVEVPEDTYAPKDDKAKEKKKRVSDLLTEAARFFYKTLHSEEGKKAIAYIKKRELSPATVTNFGLGYSPEGWDNLYRYLKDLGYTDEEMEGSGLFTRTAKGNLIDLFRGRLMFPIMDEMGRIVAFGGRSLGDEMPKYINSPDSLVYKKQNHLYALNFAKKERSKQLIIVEGYMDAIAMHQAGVRNTVASLGTAFTDSQLKTCARYAEEVIFFFDSDNAGQMAALRAIKMMLGYLRKMTGLKIKIKIAKVPGGKDPDEYIRINGAERFAEVVRSAKYVDQYLTDRAYDDNYTDGIGLDTEKYQDDICLYGSLLNDEIKRSKMAGMASVYLKAKPEIILSRMKDLADNDIAQEKQINEREARRQYDQNVAFRQVNESGNEGAVSEDELNLMALAVYIGKDLVSSDKIAKEDILRPGDFANNNMKEICKFFLDHFDDTKGVSPAQMVEVLKIFTLNNEPAENLFFRYYDEAEKHRDINSAIGYYLLYLYKIRLKFCETRSRELYSMLGSVKGEDREKVMTELEKLEYYSKNIKKRQSQL